MPQRRDRKAEYQKEYRRLKGLHAVGLQAEVPTPNEVPGVKSPEVPIFVPIPANAFKLSPEKEARRLDLRGLLDAAKEAYEVEQAKAKDGLTPDYKSINTLREPWFEELHKLEQDRPGSYWIPARYLSEGHSLEVVKRGKA